MPPKSIHLICNAHLDPVWQWDWEEGISATLSTFRTAADFCETFDGFVFNHNEAILYQWTEEYDPKLFERIRKLVKAGKWHIMGGWFLQPDCNMPSGESFVRQIQVGRKYFKDKFGVEPTTAINFDPFGHTRGLVQILAKSGYDSYLFCRPGGNDLPLPSEQFVWVGFDGSEVLATRLAGYHSIMGHAREKVQGDIDRGADQPVTAAPWGIGNHGGGPSKQDLVALSDLIAESRKMGTVPSEAGGLSPFSPDIRHSTPEAYFAELSKRRDDLPRREDDLNPWAVGCYTSQIRIKQKHRLLENEYYATEKMATAATAQGLMEYPSKKLDEALYDLLFSEFHDILPGSSVQPVEDTSLRRLDHGLEIISRVKTRAFFALTAGQPKAKNGEAPILVYNPHPYPVDAVIECELQLPDQNWSDEFTATPVFRNGEPLPYQNEKEAGNVNLDWRKKVVFAATLEPSSMNRFDCRYELVPQTSKPVLDSSEFVFKTPDLEVVINTQTGLIDAYRVRKMGTVPSEAGGLSPFSDYAGPGCFEPLVIMDDPDPWGMRVRSFREIAGRFTLMSKEKAAYFSGIPYTPDRPGHHDIDRPGHHDIDHPGHPCPGRVRIVEDGPVRCIVEALLEYNDSAICMRYILPKKGSEIGVIVRVHWNEKDRMLKLAIPNPSAAALRSATERSKLAIPLEGEGANPPSFRRGLGGGQFLGQVAYGVQELPTNGDEAVAQKWLAVVSEDGTKALTVINDGTYGSDFSEDGLRLTLLRSPAYTAHPIPGRPLVREDRFEPRIDQGERIFRFWLNAGDVEERLTNIDREALAHNEKPFALQMFPSGEEKGERGEGEERAFVILKGDTVQMTAMKLDEDNNSLIIRLFEPTGQNRSVTLAIPSRGIERDISLSAFEIKTLEVDLKAHKVLETNLMERKS